MQLSIYLCPFERTQINTQLHQVGKSFHTVPTLGSFTLHFGLKYEMIYQLDAVEYLFVSFRKNTNKYSIASSW